MQILSSFLVLIVRPISDFLTLFHSIIFNDKLEKFFSQKFAQIKLNCRYGNNAIFYLHSLLGAGPHSRVYLNTSRKEESPNTGISPSTRFCLEALVFPSHSSVVSNLLRLLVNSSFKHERFLQHSYISSLKLGWYCLSC